MKYSVIITAWKEPITVSQNIEMIINPENGNLLEDLEILLVCPDDETFESALNTVENYNFKNFKRLKDTKVGKPAALNLALEEVKGEILILTDGDVRIEKNSLTPLVEKFSDESIGAVTGRPKSNDSKSTLFGYWGNLLADAAHDKRSKTFSKGDFYFVSGYLYATRNLKNLRFPTNTLVDDAWITLEMVNRGYKIAYSPKSIVWIKYPKTFKDWLNQKKRSKGGYEQLKYIKPDANLKQNHTVFDEMKYALFPITYADSLKEFVYSLALFPARIYLWIAIFYERKVKKKSFSETWVRIESTKK